MNMLHFNQILRPFSFQIISKKLSSSVLYTKYTIYKDQGALSIAPILPTITLSANGLSRNVSKPGGLLLTFVNVLTQSDSRQFDWNNKSLFMLNIAECGVFLDKHTEGFSLIHDSKMGGALSGQIVKSLLFKPIENGSGMLATLKVVDKVNPTIGNTKYEIPVSWGEMQVLRCLVEYSVPRMLAFDMAFAKSSPNTSADNHSEESPVPF